MNTYYFKMLLFNFLINTFIFPYNENYGNKICNISLTQRTTIKSRLLTELQKHNNPHYHNDPELKKIIDKLNEEEIKKYQQSHEPHEQLQKLIEKNGTKSVGGHSTESMSTIEKELLETYEEIFGNQNYIMLKSDMYTNEYHKSNDKNDKYCECVNKKSSDKLSSTNKVHDKYLDNLKSCCVGGAGGCSISSILTGSYIVGAGVTAAKASITASYPTSAAELAKIFGIYFFSDSLIGNSITSVSVSSVEISMAVTKAVSAANAALFTYGIAALVLILIAVVLIILYVWLRKRRILRYFKRIIILY